MRLIDRPLRPLWPDGFSRDVLIQCFAYSAEPDVDPDVVAMIAASAALSASSLPFLGPIGAVRVGYVDNQYVLNPGVEQLGKSALDLVLAVPAERVKCGRNCSAQKRRWVSIRIVTGPALTRATSIAAWKRPVTTGTPRSRAACTTASISGAATSAVAAAV